MRVFVAEGGAVLRQGDMRLAAPRMVVWFDEGRSSAPDVQRAIVRVYAEGEGRPGQRPRRAVRLVEGDSVRAFGALAVQMTSSLAFVWDAPLVESDAPQPSALLAKARSVTEGVEQKQWVEIPPMPEATPLEEVSRLLKAQNVEVFWDEQTVVYRGDVRGSYGNLDIRADAAVLWFDQETQDYEIYAEGDVRLSRDPDAPLPTPRVGQPLEVTDIIQVAKADRIYVNLQRRRGLATNVELRAADPRAGADLIYAFRGKRLYLIDSSTLTMREATITTCPFEKPHFQFQTDRVQVTRRRPSTIVNAWDVDFQVGEEPRTLLWIPFLGTDLTERAYLLEEYAFGSSNKFGAFLQTTWRPLDLVSSKPEWVERWAVNLDIYGSRGPGLGTELEYQFGADASAQSEGDLRAYYVHDSADEDDDDTPVPKQDRGRFHLRHRTNFTPDWRVDGEFYWLSDEGFLSEFFEADFEEEKTPESYLLARYLKETRYLALLYKQQVNDFITQLEQTPSADLQIIGYPLGRLVYDGSVTAGIYDLEPSDRITPAPADPPDVARAHTVQELSLPFNFWIFRLDPSVKALATWADESVQSGGAFSGSESRTGVAGSLFASTTFSRAFDTSSELLDLNRLRHIVIPFAGIETVSTSGGGSEDFIQMDQVDTIDDTTEASIGLRQRLQTKRMRDDAWRSVDWMDLRVAYVSRSSDSVDPTLDEDFISWDLELLLTNHISLHSRDSRLGIDDLPDIYNAGIRLNYLPVWALSLDYDRIEDRTSAISADLFCRLSDRYQLLLLHQQELDSGGRGDSLGLETEVVIRRLLDQWILDLGVRYERANNETAVVFGFGPAGWGVFQANRRPVRQ